MRRKRRSTVAGQSIGANTAGIAAAEAAVADARSKLANAQEQTARIFQLVERQIYAKARGDQARRQLEEAEAGVNQAEAQLEQARQQLGPQGQDNPESEDSTGSARAGAARSQRYDGGGTDHRARDQSQLAGGQFVAAGQPVMTFIDPEAGWISTNFRENNLGLMKAGDPVEVALDVRPGEIFPGVVESIGWGVDVGETTSASGLPTIRRRRAGCARRSAFPCVSASRPKGTQRACATARRRA